MRSVEEMINNPSGVEVSKHYDELFNADAHTLGSSFRWMVSPEDCQWQYENQIKGEFDLLSDHGETTDPWHLKILDANGHLRGEVARLREALDKCLIGGNSLASVIIGWSLPAGYENWSYEATSKYFYDKYDEEIAYEYYETWLCWKAIREAGEMVEALSSHTVDTEQTSLIERKLALAVKWLEDIRNIGSATSMLATAALCEIEAVEEQ
ncbi:hypothetical protein [Cohnella silvisoli]|uniref:Uncharacterized protein n=1 Tax=Cohnella silvisoli TaxID=2873699 RepID=A0ABV1L321_9BACL|nr:hypothetical protein [Cohnella silvisoli]MCD9025767.1 hypothetical protein [Cohnella silvisoli]